MVHYVHKCRDGHYTGSDRLESHVGCAEWAPAVAVGGAKDSMVVTQCAAI